MLDIFAVVQLNQKLDMFVSRYEGEFSVYEIVDWMATNILGLPRIYYYSKEALVIHENLFI